MDRPRSGLARKTSITLAQVFAAVAALALVMTHAPGANAQEPRPALLAECGTALSAAPQVIRPVQFQTAAPAPGVTAAAAVVIDAESGKILYDHNAHERRRPASTTKIMTAVLALEHVSQENWVVSETDGRDMVGSSIMGLRKGMYVQMRDLLYGLMLPSGNDAAVEIAKNTFGTQQRFIDKMNEKVDDLGLENTHFMNPHGLDGREHYSSAYDLAMIGRYAMRNEDFRRIVAAPAYQMPAGYAFSNGNSLLAKYPGADGLKIGWTNRAGWTLVASAERDGRRLIVTVLKSEDRDADAAALFDWAFASHEWKLVDSPVNAMLRVVLGLGRGGMFAPEGVQDCAVRGE